MRLIRNIALFLLFGTSASFANTTTSNLGLTLPTTGQADVWGRLLNRNFQIIDSSSTSTGSNNTWTGNNVFVGSVTFSSMTLYQLRVATPSYSGTEKVVINGTTKIFGPLGGTLILCDQDGLNCQTMFMNTSNPDGGINVSTMTLSKVVWADGTTSTTSVAGGGGGGSGDITGVAVSGAGLTGGATSGNATITIVSTVAYTTMPQTFTQSQTLSASSMTFLGSGGVYQKLVTSNATPNVLMTQYNTNGNTVLGYLGAYNYSYASPFVLNAGIGVQDSNGGVASTANTDLFRAEIGGGNRFVSTKGGFAAFTTGYYQMWDADSDKYVALRASDTVVASANYILPDSTGTADMVWAIRGVNADGTVSTYWKADSAGAGGSGAIEVVFGVSRTSPTATIIGNQTQFTGTVSGSTMAFAANPSTFTMQGNSVNLTNLQAQANAIGLTTSTLQTNINAVGVTTGTLGASIAAVSLTTGTLKTAIDNKIISLSTGTVGTFAEASLPHTYGSSLTITSPSGLSVQYGITAGSLTVNGAGWPTFNPGEANGVDYKLVGASSTITVGQVAIFSSTNGAVIGGTGGSGTPGGSSGQLQYNSASSFAGVTGSVVTASSVTLPRSIVTSSLTVIYGGGNSGNTAAVLNVYKGDALAGDPMASFGSNQNANQFTILDQAGFNSTLYGGQAGSIVFGGSEAGTNHRMWDINSTGQSIDLWNNGEMELKTTIAGNGGKDITLYPGGVESVRVSTATGIIVSSTATFKSAVSMQSIRWADGSTSTSSVFGSAGGGSGGGGYAVEPATVSVQLAKGLYIGTNTVTTTATYLVVSTDTVVYASSTFNGTKIVQLPAANSTAGCKSGSGKVVQITKVDSSTGTVNIIPTGSDLLLGTTRSVLLNAISQTAEFVSDCQSTWWPHGIGIQATPKWIGYPVESYQGGAYASSTTVRMAMDVSVPVAVTGFRFYISGGVGGNATMGIYDKYDRVVVSTGPVAVGTFGPATVEISPVNLPPGQYWLAWKASNSSISISGQSNNGGNGGLFCSAVTGTTMALPDPYGTPGATLGCIAFQALVAGGRTGL